MSERPAHLQAVIFDIDGTLVDSNDLHASAWHEAFRHFGKELPYELVRSQIGKGGDLLVPDLLNAREMRQFGDSLREFRKKLYKEQYMEKVRPFEGSKATLRALRERGLRLAFASSADADEVKYYVRLLDAGDLLDGTTSKKDANLSKPSPEIFEAALKELDADDAATVVVGDTPYDILAAHRIALPIVAVRSGGFPDETLLKAEFLFDGVEQLTGRIDEIDDYFAAL
jgi:HAD superfamily hydrolase (TIGR01549 family)